MQSIADLGVDYATVHCGESTTMLEAAVAGAAGRVGVLAVTVLTSVNSEDIQAAGYKEEFASALSKLVLQRSAMAKSAGCAGVVCSGLETQMIKKHFGQDFLVVTPGIRPPWATTAPDDQQRVTTPAEAVQTGADYLVIGRPIRDAKDPQAAVIGIAEEIASVL
jgi:orotidine-5'-phosphate decarboxylase